MYFLVIVFLYFFSCTNDAYSSDDTIKGKIRNFLDDLGRKNFNFTDAETPLKGKANAREIITNRLKADGIVKKNEGNHLEAFEICKNLFLELKSAKEIETICEMAKKNGLIEEALDLYMMAGLLLMRQKEPVFPAIDFPVIPEDFTRTNVNIFGPKNAPYINFASLANTDKSNPGIIDARLSMETFSNNFFTGSPYLMRKVSLLFADNPVHKGNLGTIILKQLIDTDKDGARITSDDQRYEKAASLFRESLTLPTSAFFLGEIIYNEQTDLDEKKIRITNIEERINAAIRCYILSGLPPAFYNLAVIIYKKETNLDENGAYLSNDKDRMNTVVRLYIKSGSPWARYDHAQMIKNKETDLDENGKPIPNNELDRYKIIEKLLDLSGIPLAKVERANMLLKKQISLDKNGNSLTDQERYELAANQFLESNTREGLYYFAEMLEDGHIDFDDTGKPIPKENRNDVLAGLYQKCATDLESSNLPLSRLALTKLTSMIHTKKTNLDSLGKPFASDQERIDAVSELCRKLKTDTCLAIIAEMIFNNETNYDENGTAIVKEQKHQTIARLCRLTKTPNTLYILGYLIDKRLIDSDENDIPIEDEKRNESVARLYGQAKTSESFFQLATMIETNKTNLNENGNPISQKHRNKNLSRLYRLSQAPDAKYKLGLMIEKKLKDLDAEGREIPNDDYRYEVAASFYRLAKTPASKRNLARLIEEKKTSWDENGNFIPNPETSWDAIWNYVTKGSNTYFDVQENAKKVVERLRMEAEDSKRF